MTSPPAGCTPVVLLALFCACPCRAAAPQGQISETPEFSPPGFSWCADPTRLRQALCRSPDFLAFSACATDAAGVMQCPAPGANADSKSAPADPKVLEPVEIQVPRDTPKGYNEQIMIME